MTIIDRKLQVGEFLSLDHMAHRVDQLFHHQTIMIGHVIYSYLKCL